MQRQVTICPPHTDGPSLDKHQFVKRPLMVSEQSRLTFSDINQFHVIKSKGLVRHNPIPKWANNEDLLRKVILTYLEKRVTRGGPTPTVLKQASGKTDAERLNAVRAYEMETIVPMKCDLQRLLNRYESLRNAGAPADKLEQLAAEIQTRDTAVVCAERGATVIVTAVVYLSYRLNYNSVQVAKELGLRTAVHVRQILTRLHQAWFLISGEYPVSRFSPGGHRYRKTIGKWPAERLRKLFALRVTGRTFAECAKELGLASGSCARTAYRRYFGPSDPLKPSDRVLRAQRMPDGGRKISWEITGAR